MKTAQQGGGWLPDVLYIIFLAIKDRIDLKIDYNLTLCGSNHLTLCLMFRANRTT